MSTPDPPKLRIGISACLLGQEVRYNGGHKRDAFLTDTFGRYVEWVAVCPEVELGMGTPRPPIRLERRGGGGRPRGRRSGWSGGERRSASSCPAPGRTIRRRCAPGLSGGPRPWRGWS